jgi:hypothetical protein
MQAAVEDLLPVLRETVLRSARRGISGKSAYQLALLLTAVASLGLKAPDPKQVPPIPRPKPKTPKAEAQKMKGKR